MTTTLRYASILVPFLLCACSSDSDESTENERPDNQMREPGNEAPPEPSGEYERLIEGTWTLPPGGEEPELCFHKEVTEDLYISAIRPVHPPGTHHTLFTASDSESGCNASLVANGLIYAAGVGSEGLTLPEGVALKIPAGKILNLGLHLYNVSTEEITGTSGMEIVRADSAAVVYEAEAVLAGPFDIAIPPGRHTQSGTCELSQEQTIFAIFPHMHQLGVHFKASFLVDGVEKVVHDDEYFFEEQYQIQIEPLTLAPGDSIVTECTWENPTSATVGFGESSDTEMCFDVVFQYPARGSAFCGSFGGGGERPSLEGPACAEAGDPGNELGVGKLCTAGGNECTDTAGAGLCLADYVDGDRANFCSASCESNDDCGAGASCVGSGARAVCFPDQCVPSATPDAGAD